MAQIADISLEESQINNRQIFSFEVGSSWEQYSVDAVENMNKYVKVKNVLELGCGDGAAINKFVELGYTVTGVDINPEKLKNVRNATTVESDLLDYLVSLPSNSVENVFTHHTLEHCIHYQNILAEISRVLKKGGICFIVVPAQDEPHSVHYVAFGTNLADIVPPRMKTIISEVKQRGEQELWFIGEKL